MSDLQTASLLPAPSRADRNVANSSTWHCTAYAVLGDGAGVRMQAESHLELSHLFILNADPDIADLREQVRFPYGLPGAERAHVFDAVATRRSGVRIPEQERDHAANCAYLSFRAAECLCARDGQTGPAFR